MPLNWFVSIISTLVWMAAVDGDGANEDYYDYNDLQAVALLTNDNTADFDWDKKIADPIVSNASLSTFKVSIYSEPTRLVRAKC